MTQSETIGVVGDDLNPGRGEMPLDGIRVLDLSSLLAGPMTAMHLGDFGADVVKVEQPGRGDELRSWGLSKDGVPLMFKLANRNKRGITLNLREPAGQEIARRLAARSDIVVENFRPGTLERWGLGYETLASLNPKIVMARITGYGQTGPYSSKRGFGTIGEGLSGFAAVTGMEGGPPLLPTFGLGDTSTAIFGAYAIMLALYRAERTGKGQYVDLALFDGLITLLGSHVVDFDQLGVIQERVGSRSAFVAPRNIYPTGDGQWIVLAGSTQRTFVAIVEALGIGWMADDPRFRTNSDRIKNVEELDRLIAEKLSLLTRAEIMETLGSSGAAVGPIFDVSDVVSDPHMRSRSTVVEVEDQELGTLTMQNVSVRLSETPGSIRWAGPTLGSHNVEVLQGELGLTEEEMARLSKEGVC